MAKIREWLTYRRAVRDMRRGWTICDGYGALVMTYTYRPRKYTKAGARR